MGEGRSIWIVASGASESRCTFCRDRILWVTTMSRPGHRAKNIAFNRPAPAPLEVRRNDEIRVTFERWPAAALHVITCRGKQSA